MAIRIEFRQFHWWNRMSSDMEVALFCRDCAPLERVLNDAYGVLVFEGLWGACLEKIEEHPPDHHLIVLNNTNGLLGL